MKIIHSAMLLLLPVHTLMLGCDGQSESERQMEIDMKHLEDALAESSKKARKSPRAYSEVKDNAGIGEEEFARIQNFLINYREPVLPARYGGVSNYYSPYIFSIANQKTEIQKEESKVYVVRTSFWEVDWEGANLIILSVTPQGIEVVSCDTYKR